MSKTIDERVVSMEFDNSRFEKNVATTMSTLDKLKQKLNLDGAAKGFENIDSAAKKVNLSGLSNAADQVAVKFSTMQMTIQHQLDRIVDSAVDAGIRLAKSLSVDQITAGWEKYGQKTASVQTIMNATGASIEEVNGYLNKLMWFSDETSYGFTDMTQALGQLTSAGGKVEKLLPMIMGIANATAFAGKGTAEFSRAIYNLNQSYSAGYLQYMDWKSLDMAGVSSKQLKETFIEVAEAMGKIEKGAVTVTNFNETLKDKWADTSVMEAAFGKFAEMTELAYEMVNSGEVETASEAYEILSKQYDGISITAAKAAQEAKTFTEAIDATKDAVSSGWMRTFENIFGNYKESKKLWTDVANQLWDIFASGAEDRNEVLADALDSSWSKLIARLNEAGVSAENLDDAVYKTLMSSGKNADALLNVFGSFEKAFTSGALDADILRKALHNIETTVGDLTKIDRILYFGSTGDDVKELQTILEELGHSVGEYGIDGLLGPDTTAAIKEFQELKGITVDGIVGPETIGALEQAQKETAKWSNENEELIKSYDDLINAIDKTGGRDLLAKSITNTLEGLAKVVTTVKEAFGNIFNISSDTIYGIAEAIHSFSEKLIMSDETADKLRESLEGLFAIIDTIRIVLSGAVKIALSAFTAIFSKAGSAVLDVTSSMSGSFIEFRDTVKTVVDNITKFFAEQIPQWIKEFKETEFFKTVATWFEDASETISGAIDTISEKFNNFEAPAFIQKVGSIGECLKGLGDRFAETGIGSTVVNGFSKAFEKIGDFFAAIPKWTSTDFANIFASFEGVNLSSFPSALATFAKTISNTVITKTKTFFKNLTGISWDDFKGTSFDKFMDIWISISEKAKEWAAKGKEFAESLKTFIFGTEPITLSAILEVAEKILGIVVLIKALNLLSGVIQPFDNITDAIDNFASALKWASISSTFKSMAIALGALTLCIVVLTQIDDMNKAVKAAKMLGQLIVVMGAVAALMGIASSKLGATWDTLSVALSMLAMIGALVLLVHAMKELDAMEFKDPTRTFAILTGALLALVIGMSAIAIAGGSSFKSVAAILTMITALKMLLGVIDEYEQHDWSGQSKAIRKMTEMLLVLSAALAITSIGAGGSTGLALTIVAMVLSLRLLLNAIKEFADVDDATMERGGQAVVKLLGVMTLMGVALSLANSTTVLGKGQRSVNSFRGLAVSLLAVVAAIWLLGKMATKDEATFTNGMEAVITILGMFAVALGIIGLASNGLNTTTVISMLVMIGVLLAEMAFILKMMETIPVSQSLGSAAAITMIMLAMVGMLSTLKLGIANPKVIIKWVGMITALAGLVIVLGGVLSTMADVPWQNSLGSAAAMSLLLSAMALALMTLSKYDIASSNIWPWVGAMYALVPLMAVLGLVLTMMTALPISNAITNAAALGVLINAMSTALLIMSQSKSMNKQQIGAMLSGMMVLTVVMAALGLVLSMMSVLPIDNALANVSALSVLINAMSTALLIMSQSKPMSKQQMGAMLSGMMVLTVVMAALGLVLAMMSALNITNAIPNVLALSVLINAMSTALLIMSQSKSMSKQQMSSMLSGMMVLTVVMAALGLVLAMMSALNADNVIPNALALGVLVNALSSAMLILSYATPLAQGAIGGMFALSGVVAILAVILGLLSKFDCTLAISNALSLGVLLNAMATAMVILSYSGPNAIAAMPAMYAMSGVIAILAVVLGVLAKMQCELAISTAISLSVMLIAMSAVFAILGLTGRMAGTAISGAVGLVAVIGILGAVAVAIGALMSLIPAETISKWKTGLEDFMDFLGILAEGLGAMVGGFVVGFTDGLAEAGENLKAFANSLGDIKPEAVSGVQALCDAINALTGANLKDALTQLLPGDNSLSSFGENIAAFAVCIKDASIVLKDITDEDVTNIERSAIAGEALAELNKCIPGQGGLWQKIAGEKDLSEWGAKISAFADSLIAYSNKITGNPIDSDAIVSSANAGTAIAELNNSIPRDGGEWQEIAGSQDIAEWGTKIVSFAQALIDYSNIIAGNTFDKQAILESAEAASALAEVNAAIPKQDGWWQLTFGDQDMATFGNDLKGFADGLVTFGNAALDITTDKIDAIKNTGLAVDEIQLVVDKLDKTGGTADWFGNRDPGAFGTGIQALANGVKQCIDVSTGIESVDPITKLGEAVTAINDVVDIIGAGWVNSVTLAYIQCFEEMALGLKGACDTMKTVSNANYDFSNLETLKLEMSNLSSIFDDIDVNTLLTDWSVVSAIAVKVANTADSLSSISSITYGGIDTLKGALTNLAGANVDGVIETFSGKSESISAAVNGVVNSIAGGLSEGVTKVSTEAENLMNAAVTAIENKKTSFRTAAATLVCDLIAGFADKFSNITAAGTSLGKWVASGVGTNYTWMYSAGKNLGDGLILGINAKQTDVYWAAYNLGQMAVQGEKDGQESNSPSKATIKAGKWLGEGLVIGINKMGNSVYDAGNTIGRNAVGGIANSIRSISEAIDSDMDIQPTIRPVLDLSDVRSGANAIGGLLGAGAPIGVQANISSISSMMGSRSQNGTTNDVITAINKLRNDLGNVGNTTYSINGVTYDDGSNIAEAVRTITRAAVRERRV